MIYRPWIESIQMYAQSDTEFSQCIDTHLVRSLELQPLRLEINITFPFFLIEYWNMNRSFENGISRY